MYFRLTEKRYNYPVAAQIESDNTLPVNSDVIKNGINFTLNGGTSRGNNLFHSFKKFNIPTGGEAFFNASISSSTFGSGVGGNVVVNAQDSIELIGEATGFALNALGEVELVAQTADNSHKWQQMPDCGEV